MKIDLLRILCNSLGIDILSKRSFHPQITNKLLKNINLSDMLLSNKQTGGIFLLRGRSRVFPVVEICLSPSSIRKKFPKQSFMSSLC